VINKKEAYKYLFTNEEEYYFKKDDSNQGKGVIKITKNNFDIDALYNNGDAVIQQPIEQSKWFDEIVTGSVATIRITTIKDKDKNIRLGAAYLRLGRSDSSVVQSKTAIRVPILDEEGTLNEYGS